MLEVLGDKAQLFDLYARKSQVASQALSEQEEADEEKSAHQQVLKIEKERVAKEAIYKGKMLN